MSATTHRNTYLHFPDRDALVLAAMQRCHEHLVHAGDDAEAAHEDPALALRAGILARAAWAQQHPGLYKVLHESLVNRRLGMPFKQKLLAHITAAVQRCMDAGIVPPGDAATIALDLRVAVNGMLSLRINEPGLPWPPAAEQIDRFLVKLADLSLPENRDSLPEHRNQARPDHGGGRQGEAGAGRRPPDH